jgi:hypothetical protein
MDFSQETKRKVTGSGEACRRREMNWEKSFVQKSGASSNAGTRKQFNNSFSFKPPFKLLEFQN